MKEKGGNGICWLSVLPSWWTPAETDADAFAKRPNCFKGHNLLLLH